MTAASRKKTAEPIAPAPGAAPRARRQRHRIAAIDIGTNSIHMIIVEAQRHGYRVIDKEKEMVQLGRDSLEGRPLTDAAIDRGVGALKTMAEIARRWKVDDVVAVATSAIREAPNRRRFLTAAAKASGIKIRVISGEEEADYIYRAVRAAVDFHGGTALSIDIGGGSVELIVGTDAEVFFTRSEPAGALRIAQKFALDRATTDDAVEACRVYVKRLMRKTLARISNLGFDFTVGTSGTIVALAGLAPDDAAPANGNGMTSGLRWLSRARLKELIAIMAPLSPEDRAKRFSIDTKRAETILGGAVVLDELMKGLDIERLRASDAALREGIVEYILDLRGLELGGAAAGARKNVGSVRRSSVMELAKRSNVERGHSAQVAKLALRLFDQTQELHLLRTGERELLEYAAILHEIGTHVSYQSHHKHSYYLISHAALRGFTSDQVAIVANTARYYRKSPPKEEHQNFLEISPAQRDVVLKLSAILRIAAALDRGRRGAVRDIGVAATDTEVHLELRPRDDATVELEAAERKAKLFEKVFERRVTLSVA
jgi:exopolyphosphatase/guanosine-5'-triphosphate,3'-diphosphate pyrophosphatase